MLPAEITLLGWPTWSAACACGFACLSCLLLLLLHFCLFVCCCLKYSPWVAVLVSGLCFWFFLFVLFVVVALVSVVVEITLLKNCRFGIALNP